MVAECVDNILYEWEYFNDRALREERVQCPTSHTVEIMINCPDCLVRAKRVRLHAKDQESSGMLTAGYGPNALAIL